MVILFFYFKVERNKNTIHEIELSRKNGKKLKKIRSITPKKTVNSHLCEKFKGDPTKFFTNNPPNSLLKSFNIEKIANALKGSLSTGKLTNNFNLGALSNGVVNYSTINQEYKNIKNINSESELVDFNINSCPSRNVDKEKELKNMISNVNLETV